VLGPPEHRDRKWRLHEVAIQVGALLLGGRAHGGGLCAFLRDADAVDDAQHEIAIAGVERQAGTQAEHRHAATPQRDRKGPGHGLGPWASLDRVAQDELGRIAHRGADLSRQLRNVSIGDGAGSREDHAAGIERHRERDVVRAGGRALERAGDRMRYRDLVFHHAREQPLAPLREHARGGLRADH
jgi:hypothetical protein